MIVPRHQTPRRVRAGNINLSWVPMRNSSCSRSFVLMPGAFAPKSHCDIPPAQNPKAKLFTSWVSLQPITTSMGPTVIFPRTHLFRQLGLSNVHGSTEEEIRWREFLACSGPEDSDAGYTLVALREKVEDAREKEEKVWEEKTAPSQSTH